VGTQSVYFKHLIQLGGLVTGGPCVSLLFFLSLSLPLSPIFTRSISHCSIQEAHDDNCDVIRTPPFKSFKEKFLCCLLRVHYRPAHSNSFLQNTFSYIATGYKNISSLTKNVSVGTLLVTTSQSPSLARMRNSRDLSTTSSWKSKPKKNLFRGLHGSYMNDIDNDRIPK
jgi:hypothetical protein